MLQNSLLYRVWLAIGLSLWVGCEPSGKLDSGLNRENSPTGNSPNRTVHADATADHDAQRQGLELWREVCRRYANLDRYSDQAKLHLRYELGGQTIYESFPMSVAFDRQQSFWTCEAFRTRLFVSAQRIELGIDEPATNNLDGQVMVIPNQDDWLEDLLSDRIAKLYLSGGTDVPVRNTDSRPLLFAPQLEWLLGNTLVEEANILWLGQTSHRGKDCIRLGVNRTTQNCEFWISADDQQIHRIVYSDSLLDPDLKDTPDLRILGLTLELDDVRCGNTARPPAQFDNQVEPHLTSHRFVKHFVKIPEAFPSPWIGRKIPELTLRTNNGQLWKASQFSTQFCVALLLPQRLASEHWWEALRSLVAENGESVQSILILDYPDTKPSISPASTFTPPIGEPVLAPYGDSVWMKLGLGTGAYLVIWDRERIMQYAVMIESPAGLALANNVVQRLQAGENVGQDMIQDYQQFYAEYLEKLSAVTLPE